MLKEPDSGASVDASRFKRIIVIINCSFSKMSFCSRGAPDEYESNNADQSEDCNERSNPSPDETSDVKCSHIKIDQNMKG